MHRSWGNAIEVDEAFDRMGADVMRWQFSAASQPEPLVRLRPRARDQRRLLTLWNSAKFLADYANIEEWSPTWGDLASSPAGDLQPLDRWLVARTGALVEEATAGYELAGGERRPRFRHVRRGRVELVHPAVSAALLGRRRNGVADLWYALAQGIRVIARSCRSSATTSGAS